MFWGVITAAVGFGSGITRLYNALVFAEELEETIASIQDSIESLQVSSYQCELAHKNSAIIHSKLQDALNRISNKTKDIDAESGE